MAGLAAYNILKKRCYRSLCTGGNSRTPLCTNYIHLLAFGFVFHELNKQENLLADFVSCYK